ncbi:MAG: hypothetical protein IJD93_09555 [Ruminococcus sp.]|nr:hypothetical protein [Ruminococcus sp.]MBQ2972512.1 hypothetical protein [Ruminococcus sp.]
MKRIICAALAVLMVAVLFTGCKVKTTVDPEYVDSFINDYASPDQVDESGAVTYQFESKKIYDQFTEDYYEKVKEDSRVEIKSGHQYSYYNPDITEIVVGVTPESYEELGIEAMKEEAQLVGKEAIKYQMNLKNPIEKIDVTYRNANTSEHYFTITVEA